MTPPSLPNLMFAHRSLFSTENERLLRCCFSEGYWWRSGVAIVGERRRRPEADVFWVAQRNVTWQRAETGQGSSARAVGYTGSPVDECAGVVLGPSFKLGRGGSMFPEWNGSRLTSL